MKIIKRGVIQPKIFTATCPYCGSVLEAEEKELKKHSPSQWEDRDEYRNEQYTGTCPVCNKVIYFKKR